MDWVRAIYKFELETDAWVFSLENSRIRQVGAAIVTIDFEIECNDEEGNGASDCDDC